MEAQALAEFLSKTFSRPGNPGIVEVVQRTL